MKYKVKFLLITLCVLKIAVSGTLTPDKNHLEDPAGFTVSDLWRPTYNRPFRTG